MQIVFFSHEAAQVSFIIIFLFNDFIRYEDGVLYQTNSYGSIIFFFFFDSVLRPFQDYFSSYETAQSVGGLKLENPREKPPGTPASRTWLVSHVASAGLKPTSNTAVAMVVHL